MGDGDGVRLCLVWLGLVYVTVAAVLHQGVDSWMNGCALGLGFWNKHSCSYYDTKHSLQDQILSFLAQTDLPLLAHRWLWTLRKTPYNITYGPHPVSFSFPASIPPFLVALSTITHLDHSFFENKPPSHHPPKTHAPTSPSLPSRRTEPHRPVQQRNLFIPPLSLPSQTIPIPHISSFIKPPPVPALRPMFVPIAIVRADCCRGRQTFAYQQVHTLLMSGLDERGKSPR